MIKKLTDNFFVLSLFLIKFITLAQTSTSNSLEICQTGIGHLSSFFDKDQIEKIKADFCNEENLLKSESFTKDYQGLNEQKYHLITQTFALDQSKNDIVNKVFDSLEKIKKISEEKDVLK